jgi:type III secretory pathway component EscS
MDAIWLALGREALILVLLLSGPPLAAALLVGLVMGLLQAATQVQDPSLPVVPRLVAVLAALGLSAPWIGARLVHFAGACLELALRGVR